MEALNTLANHAASLLAVVTELKELGGGLAGTLAALAPPRPSPTPPTREPERRLSVVTGRPDVLATIREDLDSEEP